MPVTTSSVAGIFAGSNPLEYAAGAPYTIFIFQAIFIILLCEVIHYPIKLIRQPKVIAEVIAGILLGPSVMGKIPGFTENCFPPVSIPGLTLFANIGIILFLFIIGLEVDINFIKKHLRAAITVGLINMAIPFGLGCAISVGFYHQYVTDNIETGSPIKFTTYMVFIGVSICITAFPVLARILTELNLIGYRVGTIVLAAGITNDLTGWILLALTVTLANSGNGINALYILLVTFGWFLFLCFPVRISLRWYFTKFTNNLITGEPSQFLIMIILVLVLISAFFTDIIGVHPIFGAFMVGVIIPRDNGFVIKITEKLEDLVHVLLIPIYFALAGLSVNLGLLNKGIDWAYTIGIILLAMVGKIGGGFIGAKFNNLFWRESLAVGVLMSCKGIVEIVVLNVGLNAGIISQKVYSMFIVMALVTTFCTTPLALLVYPLSYREKVNKVLEGKFNWDGSPMNLADSSSSDMLDDTSIQGLKNLKVPQTIMLLKDINVLSSIMSFVETYCNQEDVLKAVHLREFSSRTSHLLEASNGVYNDEKEWVSSTSILSIVKVFSETLGIRIILQSVLSTFRNHILTINDQINNKLDFLITSNKLSHLYHKVGEEYGGESDYMLYKKLLHECKCNIGLLLTSSNDSTLQIVSNDDLDTKTLQGDPIHNSLNLILEHDNLLSSSDLLSLHVALKCSSKMSDINIYIRSASQSIGFEQQINDLFISNTVHIKCLKNAFDDINFMKNQTFIIANNIPKDSDVLFTKDVNDLLGLSELEGFNVLVVKAPFT